MSGKFFAGDFHEARMLATMEFFLVPFSVLCGLLFLSLDLFLKRIHKQWLSAIVNLILSFVAVFLAYQLVFLTKAPSWVSVYNLGWKVLLVGFLIVLYRLYSRIQTQKIAGLIQQKELELAKQKELKIKSDLNALQARINPHFLYNSLNSIASLSRIDPEKTESMALSLSKLFRYNLNKGDDFFATLSEEVEMAQTYLEIEKIRFDDRMDFEIELADFLKDFRVPKFILQPLAENAVKHGISKVKKKGVISIRIFENENRVFIEIGDNGPAFPEGLISGYGLQNTYDKLKLLYQKPFEVMFVNKPEKKAVIVLSK
jgi:sensor histidine kinase YesM